MSDAQDVLSAVRQRRRELDRAQGEARAVLLRGKAVQEEIAALRADVAALEQVAALLNSIGETRQDQAQKQIESLVTLGLRTIFDPSLSFHIVQRTGLKTAQVAFVVRSTLADGSEVDTEVMDARGGGLAATVGFLLRLVVMLLSKPAKSPFLVLDETFAHVSAEYIDKVAQFLKELTERTDIQIILVTHQQELTETADKVYRFSLNEAGHTVVKALR